MWVSDTHTKMSSFHMHAVPEEMGELGVGDERVVGPEWLGTALSPRGLPDPRELGAPPPTGVDGSPVCWSYEDDMERNAVRGCVLHDQRHPSGRTNLGHGSAGHRAALYLRRPQPTVERVTRRGPLRVPTHFDSPTSTPTPLGQRLEEASQWQRATNVSCVSAPTMKRKYSFSKARCWGREADR